MKAASRTVEEGKRATAARLSWNPGAVTTGIAAATVLFLALVLANGPLIRSDFSPAGDLAADMLLIQHARDGWLLTGHYSLAGANHPGPYFLYVRYLGGVLAAPFAGGPFGAQLVGTFANSALFLGLFAALVHTIASRNGAGRRTAAAAAAAAVMVVVFQLSSVTGLTAYGAEGLRVSLADPWMPDALIAPFLVFLASSLLLAGGCAVSLVVAVFCGAALVHGYMTMPVIVGPLWLVAVVSGIRARKRAGADGFPRWCWLASAAIAVVFLLPMAADTVINYPGNIARIIQVSAIIAPGKHGVGPGLVVRMLAGQWEQVHPFSWACAAAGLGVSLIAGRYGTLWRNAAGLAVLSALLSFPAYAPSPVGLQEYQVRFFLGGALLLVSVGAIVLIVEAGRRHRAAPLALICGMVPALLQWGSVTTPAEENPFIQGIAGRMAADVPVGGRVAVNGLPRLVVATLLLELDRFGIAGCSLDTARAYLYTRERLCPSGQPYFRAFTITPFSPCRSESLSSLTERITRREVMPVVSGVFCIEVTPDDRLSSSPPMK